jgi:hypothetical protein
MSRDAGPKSAGSGRAMLDRLGRGRAVHVVRFMVGVLIGVIIVLLVWLMFGLD